MWEHNHMDDKEGEKKTVWCRTGEKWKNFIGENNKTFEEG